MKRFLLSLKIILVLVLLFMLDTGTKPREVEWLRSESQQQIEKGNYLAASDLLSQAAECVPWRNDLWEQAGIYAVKGQDYQSAISLLAPLSDKGALSAPAQEALSEAYEQTGDVQAAIELLGKSLEMGGSNPAVNRRLSKLYRRQEDYENAAKSLELLAEAGMAEAADYYDLGILLLVSRPEQGLQYLDTAIRLAPERAAQISELSNKIALALNEPDPARKSLAIGRILGALDEWELAAEAFGKAVQMDANLAEGWAFLGEAKQQMGQEGVAEIERALKLNPQSTLALAVQALYWQRQGQPELALVALARAAELEPANPAWQAALGNTAALMADLPLALDYFQAAVRMEPKNPLYWRALGDFCVRYNIHLEDAGLPAARQAYLLAPDDPKTLDLLGAVYMGLEDLDSAERFLQRALQGNPALVSAQLHLGQLYIQKGDIGKAAPYLDWVVDHAEGTPSAELAQRLLEQYFDSPGS
jgi:tetratricopeptide (TPR) repeat protein